MVFVEIPPEHGHLHGAFRIEVDAFAEGVPAEGLLDAGIQDLEDQGIVLELDLRLGRMDVDIHRMRIDIQVQEIGRGHPLGDETFVGLHHRLVQVGAAEIAAVDEEELVAQGLAGCVGPADESRDAHEGGLCLDVHQFPDDIRAQQVLRPVFQRLGRLQDIEVASVVRQREGDVGTGQRDAREFLDDVLQLDGVGLEEFPPGRRVVEEVAHGEVGPDRGRDLRGLDMVEGTDAHLGRHLVLGAAGLERDFGDGRDRGERLAAKAVGKDFVEVFRRGDLGGGVPLEAEQGIVRGHPAAVVDHLDQGTSRVRHDHVHGRGPRIDGVLHQLLHDGSGPLDDLARRDHIGNVAWQDLQRGHYSRV